jgi:Zn-dependent protease with chaperone function
VALLFAVVFIGLQYLAAPWIIGRLMHIHWDRELPPANGEFVERLCAQRGLKIPRMGIIESGTPNAFSFGEDGGTHRAYSRWVQYAGAAAAVGIGWLWLSAIRG